MRRGVGGGHPGAGRLEVRARLRAGLGQRHQGAGGRLLGDGAVQHRRLLGQVAAGVLQERRPNRLGVRGL